MRIPDRHGTVWNGSRQTEMVLYEGSTISECQDRISIDQVNAVYTLPLCAMPSSCEEVHNELIPMKHSRGPLDDRTGKHTGGSRGRGSVDALRARRRFLKKRDDYVDKLNALTLRKQSLIAEQSIIEGADGRWLPGRQMPAEWMKLAREIDLINEKYQVLLAEYHRFFIKRSSRLEVPAAMFSKGLLAGYQL
jgi:hypothetical protein